MFCKKCGSQVPDQSVFCGGCGSSQVSAQSVGGGTAAAPALAKEPEADALDVFPQLQKRYGDGYTAAQAIIGIGTTIKVVGAVAGIIVALAAFTGNGLFLFAGVVFGGLVWLGLFVCGIVICAQGQLVLANLDCAVNGSPFLGKAQKASIMSLTSVMSLTGSAASPVSSEGSEWSALIDQNQAAKCEVDTRPEGAEISVDGLKVGVSPCTFFIKRDGTVERVVTVKLAGYRPVELKYIPDGRRIPIILTLGKL